MRPLPDLTLPQNDETARTILAAHLRLRVRWLQQILSSPAVPLSGVNYWSVGARALVEALRVNPGAAFSALRLPSIGTPLRLRASSEARLSDEVGAAWVETVQSELVVRGMVIEGASVATRACHGVDDDLVFRLDDRNPLAGLEAHPDKSGNKVDLGGRSPDTWLDSLRSALSIVEMHLPVVREEMRLFLSEVVPVGFSDSQHLSASYQEAIGTVYLSLHPNPLTMAEALVHEFCHTKLNALLDLDPIFENDPGERYASPVRPDPRPIFGVLLAVHAFVAVAELFERVLEKQGSKDSGLEERLCKIRHGNREGVSVLRQHANPTPVGAALLEELVELTRGGKL